MKKKWCITIKAKTLLIVLLIIVTAKGVLITLEKKNEVFKEPQRPAMMVNR